VINVRKAAVSDGEAIAGVHVRAWQSAYRGLVPQPFLDQLTIATRADRWREILARPSGDIFVSHAGDGPLAGFLSLGASRDSDRTLATGEISALYVDQAVARTGHGTTLLSAAVGRSGELGFQTLTLWVLSSNVSARMFYERRGFAADGAEKEDDRWGTFTLHEVRYRRLLAPSTA
jgi:GNAT superfamily N-acetyltransferase